MRYKSIYLARRNPSIAPEDWPRAWRSHPRAVAQLGVVGAAIGAAIETINYCARVREPMLNGSLFDPPGVSRDHDGVAVVSSGSEALHLIGLDRKGQEAVIADEVRVFGRPADEFSMACREIVSLGAPPGKAAVIRFLARKTGAGPNEFMSRWTGRHRDLVRPVVAAGKIGRYAQNEIAREAPRGYEFDGVSEAWFNGVEEAVHSFVDPVQTALSDDLSDFCDVDRSITMLTEVIYRVPRS